MKHPYISLDGNDLKKYRESKFLQFKVYFHRQTNSQVWIRFQWISVAVEISYVKGTLWRGPCEGDLVKGKALQCDMCEWSKQIIFSLAKFIPNLLYICNHNKCFFRLKRIVAEFFWSSMDNSDKVLDLFKDSVKKNLTNLKFLFWKLKWKVHQRCWEKNFKNCYWPNQSYWKK